LYALAYGGNQQLVRNSAWSAMLNVTDRRNDTILPETSEPYSISTLFSMSGMPTNDWYSGIQVRGWGTNYTAWSLVGPSSNGNTNNRLYYRDGIANNWSTDWKGLAFLEDCNKVATPYFEGQNIYSDYEWWVVALCKLSPADSQYNYASGTMFYRRGNGIYGNGSVNFSVMKKYSTTNVYAGVIYNGFGVSTDEDAPKLCTFTYGGVKYCGLKWTGAASLDNIKTLIYDISSTGLPFYVKYFNSQSGEVFNAEIKNSIVELGSDIILYNVSTPCGLFTSANKGLEIKAKDNAWAFTRYSTNGKIVDTGLSGTTAGLAGQTGNFEIRPDGSSSNGIFVRYSNSSYGRLGVVSRSTQECSISYWNNAPTSNYPLWTVGAGIRNQYSFDWWYHNQGYKMTLDSEGKLFINVKGQGNPSCSLAIGDSDTGLQWINDGQLAFYANGKNVGFWNGSAAGLHNVTFREASNNDYNGLGLMVNGNGTANTVKPGIGFHQPGVYAGSIKLDAAGSWMFCVQGGTVGGTVQAGSFWANGGWLYSKANGCEVRIGSQNTSYVHFTNNADRIYYFDNRIDINGSVVPYNHNANLLGDPYRYWAGAYISRVYGQSDTAIHLITNYVGGLQSNPQTYFGQNIGVKVAMTGSIKYWNDTLWINGYSSGDVKDMCALHTVRDGTPQMYISTQKSDATSYGTMYLFYTSYNANKSDRPWICSTLNAYGRITTASDIYSQSWVRTVGTTGWYSESYGGGWHMTDSTWLRAYNNKQIYTASTSPDAFHTLGGVNAGGRIYAGSYIETHGGLVCAGVGNSGGASGFNVYGSFYGNASHGGIEIGASDNVLGIGVRSNDSWYIWWTNSGSIGSSSNKSYIFSYNGSSWNFTGSVVASGEVTAYSDARLKSNIHTLDYRGRLIPRHYVKDGKQSIGFIAQEVQTLYPELVLG
jgi:hypothetical protein